MLRRWHLDGSRCMVSMYLEVLKWSCLAFEKKLTRNLTGTSGEIRFST